MKTIDIFYIKNVETGEKIQVLPRLSDTDGIGEDRFGFARASLKGNLTEWESPEVEQWFFPNVARDGQFTKEGDSTLDETEKWDFVAEVVYVEEE